MGAENASSVGPTGGILPRSGSGMLRMVDDGLSVTQIVQRVDVGVWASEIDAGQMSACFNAFANVPDLVGGTAAGIALHFIGDGPFSGNIVFNHSSGPSAFANSSFLDTDLATWQEVAILDSPIPIGTRSIVVEMSYHNDSMNGHPGYWDDARLTISNVPEPGTFAILAAGLSGILVVRRKR